MNSVNEFPHAVLEDENVFIEMSDGARLAARIWRPDTALERPVPAILEYIPYRKRFGTAVRDEVMHAYLAGHGYACVRVDLRGSGESDGVLADEYLQQELDDGCEVIEWIADQPWCDGCVGMIGISWGGFNGLQIAARRPPALGAIITVCSSDDRFSDDIHHMGGCLLGDNLSWASVMFSYNTLPPDPELVGERWRQMWMDRLEGSGLWLETWLSHQTRDAYWRHGSVCENYDAIACPVLAVSGWADGYSNAVFRLLANLKVPRKGLVGPWGHQYPHLGTPGPAIGFLQEVVRWFDHWLKGRETGLMDEAMLQGWMQDSVAPTSQYEYRPGRWVGEAEWPSPDIHPRAYALAPGRLVDNHSDRKATSHETVSIQSPLSLGLFAGKWCSYASGPDLAHDQRQEDGGALVFESAPLPVPLEILGAPVLECEVAADTPVAMVAARLSDVRQDDSVTRVTYGLLNLTHRNSSEAPEPLQPGSFYRIRLHLNEIAQSIPAGNRLRLSLSTSYWPLAWPSPQPARLTFRLEDARLILPQRVPRPGREPRLAEFDAPEGAPPPARTALRTEEHSWVVRRDLANDLSTLEVTNDQGSWRFDDIDLTYSSAAWEWYSSRANEYDTVTGETLWERSLSRPGWGVRTRTRMRLTSTADHFVLHARLDAYESTPHGETRVLSRNWDVEIPRECV